MEALFRNQSHLAFQKASPAEFAGTSVEGCKMPTKFRNLQALRGIACLLILLIHLPDWQFRKDYSPSYSFLYPVQFVGVGGVELFFVISGFVITWAHFHQLGQPTFLGPYAFK